MSTTNKDSAFKRTFSQTEMAASSRGKLPSKATKKSKYWKTHSKPESSFSTDDNNYDIDRDSSVSLQPSPQLLSKSGFLPDAPSLSSSDEDEHDVIGKTPYLVKPPSGTLFDSSEMENFYARYKRSLPDCQPIRIAAELQDMSYKFRKSSISKAHFSQFQYKKPPLLFAVTNAYGIFITTSEEYYCRSTIHYIRALQPRHRVSLLVPTIQHWWNTESKAMMIAFLERFINDMKCLADNQQFRSAVERFGIVDIKESLKTLRTKLMTATKVINGQTTPGVFGLRISNTFDVPSQIHVSLAEISGTTINPSKWKKLIVPSYLHAAVMISVKGFKITKSGFSLDFNVESLAYMKVAEIQRAPKRSFGFEHLAEFKNTKKVQSSSSSDEDDNLNLGASTSTGNKKFDTSMW